MNAKPVYKSKTLVFNTATLLAIIVAILNAPEVLELVKLLPEQWQQVALLVIPAILAVANIFLRFKTDKAVALGRAK